MSVGFKSGVIELNEPRAVYYPGQVISGKIEFTLSVPLTFSAINIQFLGEAKVSWKETQVEEYNGVRRDAEIRYKSYEEYFNYVQCLSGGNGISSLPPGSHSIPFKYQIPYSVPSSCAGEKGQVCYTIIAFVDYPDPLMERDELVKTFEVVAPLDLNQGSEEIKQPVEMSFEEYYTSCSCFPSAEPLTLNVRLPVSGYCPGQNIPITVNAKNETNCEILKIIFQLITKELYHSQQPRSDYIPPERVLATSKSGAVPSKTQRNFTCTLTVPDMIVPNLENCSIIDVGYFFRVTIKLSGFHDDVEDDTEIYLGLVPLVSLPDSDRYVHPMAHRLPTGPVPDINTPPEPLKNEPYTVNPYPENIEKGLPTGSLNATPNLPFPNLNTSYPVEMGYNQNAPYPAGNNSSPYPIHKNEFHSSTYSTNNAIKSENPPYPISTLSNSSATYSVQNTEYKVTQSSSAQKTSYDYEKPPYPTENKPYPDTNKVSNVPYPMNASPYPTSMPYPGSNNSSLPYPTNMPYPGSNNSSLPYPTDNKMPLPHTLVKPKSPYYVSDVSPRNSTGERDLKIHIPMLPLHQGVDNTAPSAPPPST